MTAINEQFMAVVNGFITKEEAISLHKELLANAIPDRREHYQTVTIGGGTEILSGIFPNTWDHNHIIQRVGQYALDFFKTRYNFDDSFVLDRAFGNIMNTGAKLDSHEDYSYGENDEHDFSKKTYVCGLFVNDDYEGGELTFFDGDTVKVKPPVGSLVLFNGHSTRHGVNQILENSRVNILFMFYYTDK